MILLREQISNSHLYNNEIQKLYKAVGWDATTQSYTGKTEPVKWVRIHNLPDFVYFNHSQHVTVAGIECQTCHGPVQEFEIMKQFSPLTMGWCVNCHRETKVQFYDSASGSGNKFYSIYEKFHDDMKAGRMDSVTVEMIGGTECQKCHY